MDRLVEGYRLIEFLKEKGFFVGICGGDEFFITGFSSIKSYKARTLTWVKDEKNLNAVKADVDVCLAPRGIIPIAKTVIICTNVKTAFFSCLEHFFAIDEYEDEDRHNTYIGKNVRVGENVHIGNNCSITGNVEIGSGTYISDGVVIKNNVKIGKNCVIQALTVIGEDGFGYTEDSNNIKTMIKHYGGVAIGDDVFIGSHVNIARGTIDDTVIGDGVKIAPSTHIGHNNIIGNNSTIICSQSYGSVEMEQNTYVVGSIVKNQTHIYENAMVGMGSVVTRDVESNSVVVGAPAKKIRDRNNV